MNKQITRLGIALMVLYLALFVQLNVIQVLRADEYNDHPGNRRAIERDFNEPRGQILAADGTVLARSVPVDEARFERRREYPTGELFGHVTGYFSLIVNSSGVERSYNDVLSGRAAARSVTNAVDLLLDEDTTADVTLTIPAELQQRARDELGQRPGSVVAIDPRDGSLLALWSYPSFDPDAVSGIDLDRAQGAWDMLRADGANPLLARSYQETYFPGSTFKVVTAAAGLESGEVGPASPVYPVESAYVPPQTTRPIGNFGGSTCGGDLVDILRVSCNTAFARMGVDDVGAEELVRTAEEFGFNEAPPLDLPRVAPSPIAEADTFEDDIPVLAQTSIGQNAVRSTPLQMALVAAAVANRGTLMVPHVMSEIRDREGEVVRRFEPEAWSEVMSEASADVLTDAMVEVVEDGTAANLQVPGVRTAGKTGTAQLNETDESHAWIIGFAPAEAPRVAVAVIVEAQPGASEQTGGRVAAPIARAVLEAGLAFTE